MPPCAFAIKAGVDPKDNSAYEQGLRIPKIENLDKIAFMYDMDVFQFLAAWGEKYYEMKKQLNSGNSGVLQK